MKSMFPSGTLNINQAALAKTGGVSVYEVAGVRDPYAEREKYAKMLRANPDNLDAKRLFNWWDNHIKKFFENTPSNTNMPPAWS